MEIRLLKYFLTVACEQSITSAAEILHITQPTLSRQLMELENEIGKNLFVRGNKKILVNDGKISLTDEGILLRKRAQDIIELIDKTERELSGSENEINGSIYIGCVETHVMSLVFEVAKKLRAEHSGISFELFSGNEEDITYRLDKGLIDFGLLIEPADITKYNFIKLPAFDRWGILMRCDSPLADKEYIEPKDLWDKPLIVSRQAFSYGKLQEWIGKNSEELDIVAGANLLYNPSLMVRADMGYLFSLDKLIETTQDNELCYRPLKPELTAYSAIVWKKHQIFSKPAKLFLQYLLKEFDS